MRSQEFIYYLSAISLIHLVLFAILLLGKKGNSDSGRILALFMLIFAGVHIDDMLIHSGLAWKYHYINEAVHFLFFFLGPLYLLYTSHMTGIPVNWSKYWWVHTLPFIAAIAYLIIPFTKTPEEIRHFYTGMRDQLPFEHWLINMINSVQMGIYLIQSLKLIRRYDHSVKNKDNYSILSLQWLFWLTIWLILVCFVLAPLLLFLADKDTTALYYFQPVMTTVIYLILCIKSITFPGPDYEKQLIRTELRQRIQTDITHISKGLEDIIHLSERETPDLALHSIKMQAQRLSAQLRIWNKGEK